MPEKSCPINLIIFDWEGTLGDCSALLPGVKDTLNALHQQGFELAIATSMGKSGLQDYLESDEICELFSWCQTNDMGYSKPDPKMLQEILTHTGNDASQTIMIGDCVFDMVMATDAGIKGIGVLTGMDNAEALQFNMPHVTILDSVNDLPEFLQQLPAVPVAHRVH